MHYILKSKKIEPLSNVTRLFLKAKHCMVFISFYMFCFVKLADMSGLNSPSWLPDIHKGAITGPRANGDGRNGKLMRGWWMTDDSRGEWGKGSELIFGWILSSKYFPCKTRRTFALWCITVRRGGCAPVVSGTEREKVCWGMWLCCGAKLVISVQPYCEYIVVITCRSVGRRINRTAPQMPTWFTSISNRVAIRF